MPQLKRYTRDRATARSALLGVIPLMFRVRREDEAVTEIRRFKTRG